MLSPCMQYLEKCTSFYLKTSASTCTGVRSTSTAACHPSSHHATVRCPELIRMLVQTNGSSCARNSPLSGVFVPIILIETSAVRGCIRFQNALVPWWDARAMISRTCVMQSCKSGGMHRTDTKCTHTSIYHVAVCQWVCMQRATSYTRARTRP